MILDKKKLKKKVAFILIAYINFMWFFKKWELSKLTVEDSKKNFANLHNAIVITEL